MYKAIIFDFFGVIYCGGPEEIDKDLVALIRTLRGRYKISLLSNSSAGYVPSLLDEYGLADLFDNITISGEAGAMKPDPKIFRYALQELDLKAQEAVFIDDNPSNVAAAESIGMRSIVYTSEPSMRKGLANIGIKL